MMNINEFERTKPSETHEAILVAKRKYEKILQDTIVMDASDATRVEMANVFLKELKEIMRLFKHGL
tara:strand:- start:262 stop:459 length:198 start_codon:yes stop_codon:yes gene_type:complete